MRSPPPGGEGASIAESAAGEVERARDGARAGAVVMEPAAQEAKVDRVAASLVGCGEPGHAQRAGSVGFVVGHAGLVRAAARRT